MPFGSEAQGFDTEQKLLGRERVQRGAEISQNLNADADYEGDGSEGVPELQAVITVRRFDHLGEALAILAPVEVAGIDNHSTNGGAVSTDPFGCGVQHNICAVVNGTAIVAPGAKGIVDLATS